MNSRNTSGVDMVETSPIPGDEKRRHTSEVSKVTLVGFLLNLALSTFKIVAGILGCSQAVVADGVHGYSDGISDLAILVGVRYWTKPPDGRHPYGHARIETLVTAGIGLLLVAVAAGLIYHALATLGVNHTDPPGIIALVAAVICFMSKEALYHWTVRAGRRIKSNALVANAWHHRSDALSSVPAALAVAGAEIFPDWYYLDHIGAIVVSFFILQAALRIIRPTLSELTEAGVPEEELAKIRRIAGEVSDVEDVHEVRTRYVGAGILVDMHVTVDGDMKVSDGHSVSERVKISLMAEIPEIVDVVVHLEPEEK